MLASWLGHAEITALLLNAGADKDAKDEIGYTALCMAAQNDNVKCIELLLKAGCDVNTINKKGGSALFIAVYKNRPNCVRALVQAGADITIEVDGRPLYEYAVDTNNSDDLRAAMLVPAKKRRRCEQCGTTTTGQKMKKCGACKTVYYCNRECQTANWPLHKQVCSASDK
jgi:ankyrin repeat protein